MSMHACAYACSYADIYMPQLSHGRNSLVYMNYSERKRYDLHKSIPKHQQIAYYIYTLASIIIKIIIMFCVSSAS